MMGSLSGILQRPIIAASAVAIASLSADLRDKLWPFKHSEKDLSSEQPSPLHRAAALEGKKQVSDFDSAKFSFVTRIQVPVPDIQPQMFTTPQTSFTSQSTFPVSSHAFLSSYRSAKLDRFVNPPIRMHPIVTSPPPEGLYIWHLPKPASSDTSDCPSSKSKTLVILLGWLGAKQRHLKRYAEWYNSNGFHAITFTFPLAEILSYQVGGKAEKDVELLVNHLADWLEGESDKNVVFHTFSNTGWLTYGVILEKLQEQHPSVKERIKGCIVDSAPVAAADPQVWASGFSAAFLKKSSVAVKGSEDVKPAATEAALLVVLEKVFDLVLNLPIVSRRLSEVLNLLECQQPRCPQLYIYSSADRVIPAGSVESFMEGQRRAGREVRACNFLSTPHVDHFRSNPHLYTSELSHFFDRLVLPHNTTLST